MSKWVYFFGEGKAEGTGKMKELLGGKGAGLAEMTNLKIPVPPGFTITTDVCTYYYQNKNSYPGDLDPQVREALEGVEKIMGRKFGDPSNPLLFSVRSGARASMPGMMDTILNLGLNDKCVEGMAKLTGNPRFAYDSYRRFVAMYGDVVLGLKPQNKKEEDPFEVIIEKMKHDKGVKFDTELSADDLRELVRLYKAEIKKNWESTSRKTPMNSSGEPSARFRLVDEREGHRLQAALQHPCRMGNRGQRADDGVRQQGRDLGHGRRFHKGPALGENRLYGEFLMNAQGEDVVAGIRTPQPIEKLKDVMPKAFDELFAIRNKIENHFKDMQDFEFTIEDGSSGCSRQEPEKGTPSPRPRWRWTWNQKD